MTHWQIALGAIVALAGFIFLGRNKLQVVAPALEGADEKKAEIELDAANKIKAVDLDTAAHLQAITTEHAAVIEKLNEEQRAKVQELQDPEKLNSFLLEVGKQQRGQ